MDKNGCLNFAVLVLFCALAIGFGQLIAMILDGSFDTPQEPILYRCEYERYHSATSIVLECVVITEEAEKDDE